jgi:hypothetical protein
VFVYAPGTYSSSNQDFVRGTVTSFYEMFRQVVVRRNASSSSSEYGEYDDEDGEFYAFRFNTSTPYDEMVCPMDNMELALKIRNDAIKGSCMSTSFTGMKLVLYAIRRIVNTVVTIMYCILQIFMCLFRLLIPISSKSAVKSAVAELGFWFNELVVSMAGAIKYVADLFFELIFTLGDSGPVLKFIVDALCGFAKLCVWVCNKTVCEWVFQPILVPTVRFLATLTAQIMSFFRYEDFACILPLLHPLIHVHDADSRHLCWLAVRAPLSWTTCT